jgi:hypothetical protein
MTAPIDQFSGTDSNKMTARACNRYLEGRIAMRRAGLGLLILSALVLAGWNAELRRRVGQLEGDLAAREAEPAKPVPAPEPKPAPPEPARESVAAPEPVPAPVVEKIPAAPPARAVTDWVRSGRLLRISGVEALDLTEAQKRAVAALRKSAQEQSRAPLEVVARIEADTDAAIRNLLTPEQLARLDAGNFVAFQTTSIVSPTSKSGYLGISGEDAPGGGVRVGQVFPGSVAAAGGLQPGDVVLEANGQPVASYAELVARFQGTPPGSPVSLRIRRNGSEFYQGFQLGTRP